MSDVSDDEALRAATACLRVRRLDDGRYLIETPAGTRWCLATAAHIIRLGCMALTGDRRAVAAEWCQILDECD